MLRLNRVTKMYRVGTFGRNLLKAVDDVDVSIGTGEVVSLVGESGSGKSTIGKMVLRLLPVTAGTITYDGIDISTLSKGSLKDYYRQVQGVFQDPFSSYNPVFKADRIFSLVHAQFHPGVDEDEWADRVVAALESVGLDPDHCLNKYPHQLSGGQLQRLLIARALLLDVKFLVADEIISMLDASTRIGVLNLLADLKAQGLSILFITHDLSLSYYLSERSVILYRGRVVEMGDTAKVFGNPTHPYTRMLLASMPRLDHKWGELDEALSAEHWSTEGFVYHGDGQRAMGDGGWLGEHPELVEVEPDHMVAMFK